jgi:hypothetical protein
MRATRRVFVIAGLVALAGAGCRKGWCAGHRERGRTQPGLVWKTASADAITIREDRDHRRVSYGVQLPTQTEPALRQVQLRFRDPLEGAKVDASGSSARAGVTLLHEQRFGGDVVTVDLPGVPLDTLEVVVHHHLRRVPILRDVRFGSEVRP